MSFKDKIERCAGRQDYPHFGAAISSSVFCSVLSLDLSCQAVIIFRQLLVKLNIEGPLAAAGQHNKRLLERKAPTYQPDPPGSRPFTSSIALLQR